ncbi:MAG TPA: hypothetical protein VK942_16450, partial [Actinomycetes bacterium]|nr:hypothetical protein [Actinomycetes bacterium]
MAPKNGKQDQGGQEPREFKFDRSAGSSDPAPGDTQEPRAYEFDLDSFTEGLGKQLVESHRKLTEDLTSSLSESFAGGVKAALENMVDPQRDGPEPVRAARFQVTREAPIYAFDGRGPSLVRDAWYAQREHDDDA